jgi:hypothetical protein
MASRFRVDSRLNILAKHNELSFQDTSLMQWVSKNDSMENTLAYLKWTNCKSRRKLEN